MRPIRTLAATGALGLAALALPVTPASAQAATLSEAFADARGIIVELDVLTAVALPGVLGSTPLDPNTFASSSQSCGPTVAEPDADALLDVAAPPAATANTVNTLAGARCDNPVAVSSAQTEGLKALFNAGVPLITADVLRAQANSNCVDAPNGAGSLFTNLVVAGTPVPLGPLGVPAPNTRIDIPGIATVIVNEQHPAAAGRGIVVNALHVIGASPLLRGDLIVSHAVSGVVCANGKGSQVAEGLEAPDITFAKTASPTTAKPGQTVTYTATATNRSDQACDVLRFVDSLSPVFELVSTAGAFGTAFDTPPPVRSDGGVDVVLRPADLVLAAGQSATQTFVVMLKGDAAPGTYFNNLELFCAVNGDFVSGPLAPVTVPAPVVATETPAQPPPALEPAPAQLPRTGSSALLAAGALGLVGAGLGLRRRSSAVQL